MSAELSGHAASAPALAPAPRSATPAPVLTLAPRRRSAYERHVKRPFDAVIASVALAALLPLLAGLALLVLVQCGRPVLFRQARVGQNGVPFVVYKFRTMAQDRRLRHDQWDGDCRRRTHKTELDPRHTPVGRVLRKTSLDELPQLLNVIRGDMSLVGPRPELVALVERYEPWQRRRHDVRPGLTGLWQVSARGDRPMHELTHIDLAYLDGLSARTDLRILLATLPALLRKTGS